jgi:poly-gamma-glutamate capsule biosynthesis protein CapA/YwtB (metallophosphatase superfamily)
MTRILIGLTGDLLVNRDDPSSAFADVRELLAVPDVLFGNLEGAYTDDPRYLPSVAAGASAPEHNLEAFWAAGFDVLGLANNHMLDVGPDTMLETRKRLRDAGIATCGAGEDLSDARRPAVVEAGGMRVAFLAYTSVFPIGHEARPARPGVVPMRAYNSWREPIPTIHLPGTRPLVTTTPDETDLALLTEDVRAVRDQADLVVTSFHWGDYTRPFHLTDHERRMARHCIDVGADLVVGHHHHALRGMEWYAGKPIMYGLGHLVYDLRIDWTEEYRRSVAEVYPDLPKDELGYDVGPRDGWPLLPMHEDTRMTGVAWAAADETGVLDIGFVPCGLTPDGVVHPYAPSSSEGRRVVDYVGRAISTQDLAGRIVSSGALGGFESVRVVPGAAS